MKRKYGNCNGFPFEEREKKREEEKRESWMKGMVTTRGMGVSSPSAGASTSLGRKGRPAVRRRVSQRPAKETNMKKKTQGEPEEERRTLNALGPSGEEVTAEGIEVKKTDLQLHPVFPFMAPVLLWR